MFFVRFYRIVRVILIAIPVVVFFWLLAKDFAFSGRLDMAYDFSHNSPFVKRPWPPGRLYGIEYDEKTHDHFQRMFVEPLTFDVQLPRPFQRATVQVLYKKDTAQPLRLGIRMHPQEWVWEIHELIPVREEGEWTVGEAQFDNLAAVDFSSQRLHFLLNAPGLFENGREIALTEIRVVVEKDPITFSNFLPRLWRFL